MCQFVTFSAGGVALFESPAHSKHSARRSVRLTEFQINDVESKAAALRSPCRSLKKTVVGRPQNQIPAQVGTPTHELQRLRGWALFGDGRTLCAPRIGPSHESGR
jgi:hypothetical protein